VSLVVAGDKVAISTEQHAETVKNPNEIGILSLVPATFAFSPEIKQVTLNILGRNAVTFERGEFIDTQGSLLYQPILLSLSTTKWLLKSNGLWTDQSEATYVTFPLTQFLFDLGRIITQQPYRAEYVQQAIDSWKVVNARLNKVLPVDQRGGLTQQAVKQLDAFCDSIDRLAITKHLGLRTEADRYAAQAVAARTATYDIQQQALALRDSGKE